MGLIDFGAIRSPAVVSALFGAAVNLPWELAQSALYTVPQSVNSDRHLAYCILAAGADGIGVALMYLVGAVVTREPCWTNRVSVVKATVVIGAGAALAVTVEAVALRAGWWAYRSNMPLLPGTGVGVAPFLQFMALPCLVLFALVPAWSRSRTPL